MFERKDYLQVQGNKVINQKGKEIRLRGTNLGGWLLREGWMDGSGACLLPVPVEKRKRQGKEYILELKKISRCNRLEFPCMVQKLYWVKISLNGENWETLVEGEVALGKSTKDNYRPVPYAPGINVYDEGIFWQDNVLHMNEFFAKFIMICGEGITEAEPQRYGDIDDFHARKILIDRFGKETAEELLEIYQCNYIKKEDILYLKSLGFNFLRIPVYWQEILEQNGTIKPTAWKNLDWVIELCRELEIYVMVDYHGAPGGNTFGALAAGQLDSNEIWRNLKYQEMSCKIWRALSERYQNEPTVACYDLLNEPSAVPVSYENKPMQLLSELSPTLYNTIQDSLRNPVREFYKLLYNTVRDTGDQHILSVQLFQDLELLEEPGKYDWHNVMYQMHCYPVIQWRNHDMVEKSMTVYVDQIMKYSKRWNVPVLVGEFCCWEFEDIWKKWLKDLKNLGVHWASWNYKITDPVKKDYWSIYYGFNGEYVDYLNDSYETIRAKWEKFISDHYLLNENLAQILKRAAIETEI